jgi:hypothetical protein
VHITDYEPAPFGTRPTKSRPVAVSAKELAATAADMRKASEARIAKMESMLSDLADLAKRVDAIEARHAEYLEGDGSPIPLRKRKAAA